MRDGFAAAHSAHRGIIPYGGMDTANTGPHLTLKSRMAFSIFFRSKVVFARPYHSDISVSGVLMYPSNLASRTHFEKGLIIFLRSERKPQLQVRCRCRAYLTRDIVFGLTP